MRSVPLRSPAFCAKNGSSLLHLFPSDDGFVPLRIVRHKTNQTTEGVLVLTSTGGTVRTERLAKKRLVSGGAVIGLDEQLLETPYRCNYVTASFVHLFYFDKNQVQAKNHRGLKQ